MKHRLMIMMEVDAELPLDDIKGVVEDDLNSLLEDEDHEGAVDVYADATSHGIDSVTSVIETAELIDRLITNLRQKATQDGSIGLFGEGVGQIEHGVTDLRASARTLTEASKAARKNLPRMLEAMASGAPLIQMSPQEVVEHAPMEALHAIAHSMGLEDCDGMERADYISFIHKKLEEHEEERRKEAN